MVKELCLMTGAEIKPIKTPQDSLCSLYIDGVELISYASEQRCETILLSMCDRYYSGYGSKETDFGAITSSTFYYFDRMKYKVYRTRLGFYVFDAPITKGGKMLFYTEEAEILERWAFAQYTKWREEHGKQKKPFHRRITKDSSM